MGRPLVSRALLVLVVLPGCATGPTSPEATPSKTEPATSTTSSTTPAPPVAIESAKQRALDAEEARVNAVLSNATNVTGNAPGATSEPRATVLNVTDTTVVLEVRMSYGYEYACPSDGGGNVDASTVAIYRVTENESTLVEVWEAVDPLCN